MQVLGESKGLRQLLLGRIIIITSIPPCSVNNPYHILYAAAHINWERVNICDHLNHIDIIRFQTMGNKLGAGKPPTHNITGHV